MSRGAPTAAPPDLDQLADELAVPVEAAARFLRDGAVHRFEAHPAVVYRVRDDPAGRRRLYVPALARSIAHDPAALRELIASTFAQSTAVELLVRRELDAAWQVPEPLRLSARMLRRKSGAPSPPAADGVEIRTARTDDVAFIRGLLTEAVTAGLAQVPEELRPGAETVRRHVTAAYPLADGAGHRALVAWAGSDRIGHLTWRLPAEDLVTGRRFVEMVDVFVIPGHRSGGVTAALVDAWSRRVERENRERPVELRGSLAIMPDGSEARLARSLAAAGWSEDHELWHAYRP